MFRCLKLGKRNESEEMRKVTKNIKMGERYKLAALAMPRRQSLLYTKIRIMALAVLAGGLSTSALEVHFLQHGETTWDRSKIVQGSIPYVRLTLQGVRMAEDTAKGMKTENIRYDRIYASNLLRAYRTAEIVAEAQGTKPIVDTRLREMGMGKYEGVRYAKDEHPDDNLKNFFEGIGPYVPSGAGAESMDEVEARLKSFLDEVVRPLDGKVDKILCVTHPQVLKALVGMFAGDKASETVKNPIQRNCCVHVLDYKDGGFSVKEMGRIYYDAKAFETLQEPMMVAHRGFGDRGWGRAEASKPGYSNAVDTVCDVVKLDLRCTKDGVIVLNHDGNLKRTMGWNVNITNVTYTELYEKGRYRYNKWKQRTPLDMRIVRLDEALEILRPAPQFWVDFKYFAPEFADKVVQTFRDAKIDLSRVMVATFTEKALVHFKEKYPSIRRISHIFWKYHPELNIYAKLKPGQTPDAPFINGMPAGRFTTREKLLSGLVDYIKKHGLYGVHLPRSQSTAEDVTYLRSHGVKWVSLYFVQETEQALAVRSWGVDGFVTDCVTKVRMAYGNSEETTGTK